jgi:hypothetical protein
MRGQRFCSPISLLVALLILAGTLNAALAATAEECTRSWQQCELNCSLYPPGTTASNYCHADCATKQSVCIATASSSKRGAKTGGNPPSGGKAGVKPATTTRLTKPSTSQPSSSIGGSKVSPATTTAPSVLTNPSGVGATTSNKIKSPTISTGPPLPSSTGPAMPTR